MQRSDAGASRITIEESVQPLAFDPIPYTVKMLSALRVISSAGGNERDHVGLIGNDEVRVIRVECEGQWEPIHLNGSHWFIPPAARYVWIC